MRGKNIKDLLDKFLDDDLSGEELDFIYQSVNLGMHEDEIKAWFYRHWDESESKTKKIRSSELFKSIEKQINKNENLSGNFSTQKNHGSKRKHILLSLLKYSAIFIIGFSIAIWLVYRFNDTVAIPEKPTYNEVTTPLGSKTRLMLTDGTQVWLNAGSKLKYPDKFGNEKREIFLEGEAFFDVMRDKERPFFVKTNEIDIKVLGTQFNVKSYPEENTIETTLVTGSIEIETKKFGSNQKQQLTLKPNQKATFSKSSRKLSLLKDKLPEKVRPGRVDEIKISGEIDTETITSWKDNKLVFSKERFEDILVKMERWYDVEILLKDENLGDYRYTGAFEKETLEQALNALKLATPFEYSIDKNYIVIHNKD
jgi:ferric-dicitrate binding protein FerR (iron transport regulator)